MSSSVSNPYTFNIQRDTAFSTRINKGIVDTFTTTCEYSEKTENVQNYKILRLDCTDFKGIDTQSDHTLYYITTYVTRTISGDSTYGRTTVSFLISRDNEFPYSKIILNGGPFNTVELTKSSDSSEVFEVYECNTAYVDKTYDNATIELSITYVD